MNTACSSSRIQHFADGIELPLEIKLKQQRAEKQPVDVRLGGEDLCIRFKVFFNKNFTNLFTSKWKARRAAKEIARQVNDVYFAMPGLPNKISVQLVRRK